MDMDGSLRAGMAQWLWMARVVKILHTIQTSHVIYMGQTIQTLHDLGDLDDLDNSDGSDAISKSDGVDVLVELASDV